jgi:hypothetical protein
LLIGDQLANPASSSPTASASEVGARADRLIDLT